MTRADGAVDHRVELGLVVDHVEPVASRAEGPGVARALHPRAARHVGREVGSAEMQRGRDEDLVGAALVIGLGTSGWLANVIGAFFTMLCVLSKTAPVWNATAIRHGLHRR